MSKLGVILTEEQAIELRDVMYTYRSYFNPILIDGVWMITKTEIDFCTEENYFWLKDLPIVPIPEQLPESVLTDEEIIQQSQNLISPEIIIIDE